MRNVVIVIFVVLLLVRCGQDKREVAPGVAKLVGTWQLTEPDSVNAPTLVFALDMAAPPKDITHFQISGKAAINTYTGFLSAAVDGYMVVTNIGSTKMGGTPEAMKAEHIYITNLRAVARYDMPTDNLLRLSHGGDKPGTLVYSRIK